MPRRTLIVFALAVAGLIVTAGMLRPNVMTGGESVDPAGARLFVAVDGSDSNPCTRVAPCASFDRAYRLADRGLVVEVGKGVYGPQTLGGSGNVERGMVVFRPAAGETVSTGEIRTQGTRRVEFRDMTIDDYYIAEGSDEIVFRNDDTHAFYIRSASRISLIGGRVGGTSHAESATIGSTAGSTQPSRSIVIDGVEFHDMTRADAPGGHSECLFVQSVDGLVLRNSRFHGCDVFDVYINNILVGPVSTNLLIENTFFGSTTSGGFYSLFVRTDPGETRRNITIRNNAFQQGLHLDPGTYENTLVAANVGALTQLQCTSGISYAYNVWDAARCSATDSRAPSRFRDPSHHDLHVLPGAAAVGHGDPSGHPRFDIDGDSRPRARGSDAGADQLETALIVSGHSIGAATIGETRADVVSAYGRPRGRTRRRLSGAGPLVEIASYRAHGHYLAVIYDGDRVVGLSTPSDYYATAAGAGPGTSTAGVRRFKLLRRTRCGDAYRSTFRGTQTYFVSDLDRDKILRVITLRNDYSHYCRSASR